jgi:hypothetical protein
LWHGSTPGHGLRGCGDVELLRLGRPGSRLLEAASLFHGPRHHITGFGGRLARFAGFAFGLWGAPVGIQVAIHRLVGVTHDTTLPSNRIRERAEQYVDIQARSRTLREAVEFFLKRANQCSGLHLDLKQTFEPFEPVPKLSCEALQLKVLLV